MEEEGYVLVVFFKAINGIIKDIFTAIMWLVSERTVLLFIIYQRGSSEGFVIMKLLKCYESPWNKEISLEKSWILFFNFI